MLTRPALESGHRSSLCRDAVRCLILSSSSPITADTHKGFAVSFDLRPVLIQVRNAVAALAPYTQIKSDDALVVAIDAALHDAAMFGFLEAAVKDDDAGKLSLTTTPPVALQPVIEEMKIDWSAFLAALPTIIALVKSLRG